MFQNKTSIFRKLAYGGTALLLISSIFVFGFPAKTLAAPPGCYALDHENFGRSLTCPANLQAGVQSGKCYGGAKNGPGPTDYRFSELADCDIESLRTGDEPHQAGCYLRVDTHIIRVVTCPTNLANEVARGRCFIAGGTVESPGTFTPASCETLDSTTPFSVTNDCSPPDGGELDENNCGIVKFLVLGINVLSVIAGLVFIFSLIFAGYQYITARDNPNAVQAAKMRIMWTIIALFAYLFMYAFLNWLVPGGVLP